MNKIVCITGATAGIGKACAQKFASASYDLIITGRRERRLEELKHELEDAYGVRVYPLSFDVGDNEAVKKAFDSLPPQWGRIEVLINNAGLALGKESFASADIADW